VAFGFDHTHRCSQRERRGSGLDGLAPSMWAADALFLCASWASFSELGYSILVNLLELLDLYVLQAGYLSSTASKFTQQRRRKWQWNWVNNKALSTLASRRNRRLFRRLYNVKYTTVAVFGGYSRRNLRCGWGFTVTAVESHNQTIKSSRGALKIIFYNEMRYINLRFTYLLTYY